MTTMKLSKLWEYLLNSLHNSAIPCRLGTVWNLAPWRNASWTDKIWFWTQVRLMKFVHVKISRILKLKCFSWQRIFWLNCSRYEQIKFAIKFFRTLDLSESKSLSLRLCSMIETISERSTKVEHQISVKRSRKAGESSFLPNLRQDSLFQNNENFQAQQFLLVFQCFRSRRAFFQVQKVSSNVPEQNHQQEIFYQ